MSKNKSNINVLYNEELLQEICNNPLRSSVIVSASVLERLLEKLLCKYFIENNDIDMFETQAPLGTFSSKISMAYCLGLISNKFYKDLNNYRKIRNIFAHELVINDNILQSISDRCKNFNFVHNVFSGLDGSDLKSQMVMEFVVLYVALVKKISRLDKCKECEYEINDLGFESEDYEFMKSLMI